MVVSKFPASKANGGHHSDLQMLAIRHFLSFDTHFEVSGQNTPTTAQLQKLAATS